MRSDCVHRAMLRTLSVLVPADERTEWFEWWRSELSYVVPPEATRFCAGAFHDVVWLRRNRPSSSKRTRKLRSPIACIAVLSIVAAVSLFTSQCLEGMIAGYKSSGTNVDTLYLYLLLTSCGFLIGNPRGRLPETARAGMFLALKIMLILPLVHCVMLVSVAFDMPVLCLAFYFAYVLLFRWVFADQLRRCPTCLRRLIEPVRVGTLAQTFLEPFGAESVCAGGHGLLHSSEISASYSEPERWLDFEEVWNGVVLDRPSS